MNETTTSAANAKIARQMTDTFGLPNYEMPKMEMPAASRGVPRLMIYTALGHRSSQCAHTSSDEKSNFATIAIKHQIRMWMARYEVEKAKFDASTEEFRGKPNEELLVK